MDGKEKPKGQKMELALVLSISELIMKHGVPLALQLIKDWDVKDPTLEDVMELKKRVPRPSTYFEK
jgi:hypothetical protein